jgi:hypothetical protein
MSVRPRTFSVFSDDGPGCARTSRPRFGANDLVPLTFQQMDANCRMANVPINSHEVDSATLLRTRPVAFGEPGGRTTLQTKNGVSI